MRTRDRVLILELEPSGRQREEARQVELRRKHVEIRALTCLFVYVLTMWLQCFKAASSDPRSLIPAPTLHWEIRVYSLSRRPRFLLRRPGHSIPTFFVQVVAPTTRTELRL